MKLTSCLLTTVAVLGFAPQPISRLSTPRPSKWAVDVDEFGERLESGKTAVVAGLCAGLAATPIEFVLHAGFLPQFEFNVDQVSFMGAAFGLVFRYAVREDGNQQLRTGVVSAFALTRTLSSIRVSATCSSTPLSCGPPLGYLDGDMLWQLASSFASSAVAFGAAAYAIDYAWERSWLKRFPSAPELADEK